MAKIKCGYEIYNPTKLVNPNDIISSDNLNSLKN